MAAPKRLSPAQIINRLRKAEVALANGKPTKDDLPPKTRPSPVLEFGRVKTRKGRAQWPHQRG